MRKTRLLFVLLLVTGCILAPVFAQGATDEAYQEGWNAAKADIPYTTNVGTSGWTRPPVSGRNVVHAGSPEAAAIGYTVLVNGGNAFDAALATAAAQTFSEAMMCSIFGGDAEIITYNAKDKEVRVYNGTGWAQAAATVDYYLEKGGIPSVGIDSMHVPGEWAGWMELLRDYGTMELSDILEPTVQLAENGMLASEFTINALELCKRMGSYGPNNAAAKEIYPDGLAIGDIIVNEDYANLLKLMGDTASKGKTLADGYQLAEDLFYRGEIAEKIVDWNKANGGTFELADFSDFRAEIQEPIVTNYRGYDVYSCPPNCQGPALIEALNILEGYDLASMKHNSAEYVNLVVQALNIALNDRNKYVADPRFYQAPPEIWSKEYAAKMRQYISTEQAMASLPDGGLQFYRDYDKLGPDTTFMAVVDSEGNMCVVTHSINAYYGSGLVVDGLGIFMNDRMGYYSLDEEHPNSLAAHKRTVQTITPSLGLKDGEPAFFVGTPNANNQEQSKLQVLLNYIDFGFRPQQAVEQPRVSTTHAPGIGSDVESPGKIALMTGFGTTINEDLEKLGYTISYTTNTGSVGFGINENGIWTVGADPTRNAYSVGI